MKISVTFTQEELMLIARALTLGSIHTDIFDEDHQLIELERKIKMLIAIQSTTKTK